MNGCLVLGGGGSVDESYELDKKYFNFLKDGSKILYIPIALSRDTLGYEMCFDWFSSLISKHCNDKDIDFSILLEDDIVPDLKTFDSIYIGGGNTFVLLDFLIEKKLVDTLKQYLKEGGIIYGGSAGAIVMGKDIRIVSEENKNNSPNFLGLDLLKGSSIICHYSNEKEQNIIDFIKETSSGIIAIPNNGGMIVCEKNVETIGTVVQFDQSLKQKQIKN